MDFPDRQFISQGGSIISRGSAGLDPFFDFSDIFDILHCEEKGAVRLLGL
ncbi:hypothetical protein KNP414_03291 [Paenibacillus mucilaginosus KNP414]|uniref:Uncharacterized protein n=1 Tax=Paenibacillus mucilaginosus (strain KNP414) TaxID=1036673 RepID=F8FFD1_PAEMK|nr:hypothetical protein KNP414_03291 [Paenibacillus mucilaginosus KNP414]